MSPDIPQPMIAIAKSRLQGVIEAVLEDRLPPQVASLNRGLRRAWKVRSDHSFCLLLLTRVSVGAFAWVACT